MIFKIEILSMIVMPENGGIFDERATTITRVDESCGEFIEVSQHGRTDLGKIAIDPEEWPMLKQAINSMIELCKEHK